MLKLTAAVLALTTGAFAQASGTTMSAEFLANYDDVTKKIISLAEAVPEDKYAWRPAPGVRSIGEVLVHIAGANYMIPNALGTKMPEGAIARDAEKTLKAKGDIVPLLRKSVDHARGAVGKALEGNAEAPTKLFGRDFTHRSASLLVISHLHEHLGQLIAYARTQGVTPPWSQGRGE